MSYRSEPAKNRITVKTADDPSFGRQWLIVWFVAVLLVMGLTYQPVVASEGMDNQIRQAIDHYLAEETMIPRNRVDINVEEGIVVLSGAVENLLQKSQARQIAESIRGVRAVVDNISVEPAVREDEALGRDVRNRLGLALGRHAADISVSVDHGKVTLNGVVDSWVISRLATQAGRSIMGVSELVNRIDVKTKLDRKDTDILDDVQQRLAADLYVDETSIEVTVKEGRVNLAGVVATTAEKRRAVEDAWLAGVVAVDAHQLMVDGQNRDRMRRSAPYTPRSDAAILKAVKDALLADPRVNAYNPDVMVADGVVSLSGVVDTLYAINAAEMDALSTTGVWKVVNQLQFRYRAFPPDHEVKQMILDVFERDAELNPLNIGIAVEENQVTLTGSVKTMGQKVRAENIASQIDGVLALDNQIVVRAKTANPSDAGIRSNLVDELFWNPYVDSDRIEVTVEDGHALLTGEVTDRFAAHTAVQNAFEGGAKTVQTKLVLENGSRMDTLFRKENYQFHPGRRFGFRP